MAQKEFQEYDSVEVDGDTGTVLAVFPEDKSLSVIVDDGTKIICSFDECEKIESRMREGAAVPLLEKYVGATVRNGPDGQYAGERKVGVIQEIQLEISPQSRTPIGFCVRWQGDVKDKCCTYAKGCCFLRFVDEYN